MPSLTSNLVNPGQRREKGKKRGTVSSALSTSWYLATDTLGEISFLPPLCRSFFLLLSTPSATLLGYRDRWWLPRERNPLRIHATSNLVISLSDLDLNCWPFVPRFYSRYIAAALQARSKRKSYSRFVISCATKNPFSIFRGGVRATSRSFPFVSRVPLAVDNVAKRRRLIASINDDTFRRGFSLAPFPSECSRTVFMDL